MSSRKDITKTQLMVYEMLVRDVMTKRVITAQSTDPMSSLRDVLRRNRISGLPVLTGKKLVGLVSMQDFIEHLADGTHDCPIGQAMSGNIETVFDTDPLVHAVSRFEEGGLGRFPVVERETGNLAGILTKGDVVRGLLKKLEIDYQEEQIRHYRTDHIFEDLQADKTTLYFQYDVKGQDFHRAGTGSSRLKKTLKRLGVRPDVVRRIAIATYEAEMNMVVFTPGGEIRARVEPAEVFVEVRDRGPGIPDVEKALQPGFSTAPDWVRELGFGAGMGLPNIQKSSDRFGIETEAGKGTTVKASFFLEGREA